MVEDRYVLKEDRNDQMKRNEKPNCFPVESLAEPSVSWRET